MFVVAGTRFGNKEILIYWCGHDRLDMVRQPPRDVQHPGKHLLVVNNGIDDQQATASLHMRRYAKQ